MGIYVLEPLRRSTSIRHDVSIRTAAAPAGGGLSDLLFLSMLVHHTSGDTSACPHMYVCVCLCVCVIPEHASAI